MLVKSLLAIKEYNYYSTLDHPLCGCLVRTVRIANKNKLNMQDNILIVQQVQIVNRLNNLMSKYVNYLVLHMVWVL